MKTESASLYVSAWIVMLAVSIAIAATTGFESGIPFDLVMLPIMATLAYGGARLAKGEPLLGSHRHAGEALAQEHGGEAGGGPFGSHITATIDGVKGTAVSRATMHGLEVELSPDPPLDRAMVIFPLSADGSAGIATDRFPGTTQPALLRGDIRGPDHLLAPVMNQRLRDDIDAAMLAYRLRVGGGKLRAILPLTWKAERIRLVVEELFELAGRLTVSEAEAPSRLRAVIDTDSDPGIRHAAARVLLDRYADTPEAEAARADLRQDRDPEIKELAGVDVRGTLALSEAAPSVGELSVAESEGAVSLARRRQIA